MDCQIRVFNVENLWKLERAHESGKEGGVARGGRIAEHSEENSQCQGSPGGEGLCSKTDGEVGEERLAEG